MPTANATTRGRAIDAGTGQDSPFNLLYRCRRRLCVVAAVRYAGITLPIAMVSSAAIAFAARPGPATLAILIASIIGIALAAAMVSAMVRAPHLRDTAAALDARLRLQDRMVTALQVSNDHDPMARLVLRDAASRVAGLSPAQAFPLEAPAHFRAMVAGAVSLSVAFAIAGAAASPSWRIDRAAGVGGAATGGAQQGRASRPGAPSPAASAEPLPSPSGARSSSTAPAAAQQVARGTEPAVGRDLGRTPSALRAPGARGGSQASSTAADREVPESTVSAGVPAAARGAVGDAQGPIRAAGGVKGESLRTAASAPGETGGDSPLSPAYAARYRTASARAQAAISQERVPAGLAAYVKHYFIAIRP